MAPRSESKQDSLSASQRSVSLDMANMQRGISPTTESDLDLARWEALRSMVEAEQEVRCRTLSDFEAILSSLPAAANSVLGLQDAPGVGEGRQASFGPAREAFAVLVACLRQELQQKMANLETRLEARITEVVAAEREARQHELADLEVKLQIHCHATVRQAMAMALPPKDANGSVSPKASPCSEVHEAWAQPKIAEFTPVRVESPKMQNRAMQFSPRRGTPHQHALGRQASPDAKMSPVSRQSYLLSRQSSLVTLSSAPTHRDTHALSTGPCIPQPPQQTVRPTSVNKPTSPASSITMPTLRPLSPRRSQGAEISSVRVGFVPPGSPLLKPARLTLVANR